MRIRAGAVLDGAPVHSLCHAAGARIPGVSHSPARAAVEVPSLSDLAPMDAALGRKTRLLGAILSALAVAGCAVGVQEAGPRRALTAAQLAAVRLDPAAATAALNAYRAGKGLKPVRLDPALTVIAERQAKAMAAGDALSHEVAGGFPSRLAEGGVDATEAGENLGGGYMSLAEAMAGWRGSPGHDANLLIPAATRFGIALAKNPETQYGVYWAMEIAAEPRPRPPAGEGPFMSLSGSASETR